jgi:hypothetical protein
VRGVERGGADAAVVERDAFRLAVFEKELAVIHAVQQFTDQILDAIRVHAGACEEQIVGHGEIGHAALLQTSCHQYDAASRSTEPPSGDPAAALTHGSACVRRLAAIG